METIQILNENKIKETNVYEKNLRACLEKAKNNDKLKCHILNIKKMIKINNPSCLNKVWVEYFLMEKK